MSYPTPELTIRILHTIVQTKITQWPEMRWGFAIWSRIPWTSADNRRVRDISHLVLQKLACLLITIERDNGETDTQPPVALPSTCPLPAASRFQQMPELIRAAYASPRSRYCYSKSPVMPEDVVSLSINPNKSYSDIGEAFSITITGLERSTLFLGHL